MSKAVRTSKDTTREPIPYWSYLSLQLVRVLVAAVLIAFLSQTVDLGTDKWLLIIGAALGILLAGFLLKRGQGFHRVILLHALLFALIWGGFWLSGYLLMEGMEGEQKWDFLVYRIQSHVFLFLLFYAVGFLLTWFFWCRYHALTLEVVISAVASVWLLSGHRNYHIDAPKTISHLAWRFGIDTHVMLLGLGVGFTALLSLYLVLASTRPLLASSQPIRSRGPRGKILWGILPVLAFVALIWYARHVGAHYTSELSRTTEGVGQESETGKSPLGFHSAVGQTKQPAALVRLETDYTENPWAPMLYLREGALSLYNGRELVIADSGFDRDVPRLSPGQPYISLESEPGPFRERITQSIYLLAQHKSPFAIDFPHRMALIKNPDPDRFQLAYQALSYAPTARLQEIADLPVGNPNWDQATKAHYLRAPGSLSPDAPSKPTTLSEGPVLDTHGEDLRYRVLMKQLTANYKNPVLKATAISNYLSTTSIYTRSPGHQATKRGDPVAPYLFGEKKRGYCVHFAHAAVYLMRLAGIPARIATGYLTDLTYAKDGHILLHLGDRHAWPEIYVYGHGWLVADVTPTQAENEQMLIPDAKLLEDLMSRIDPSEELSDPLPLEEDAFADKAAFGSSLSRKVVLPILAGLFAAFIALKLYFRFAYLLTSNPKRRISLAYSSFASLMIDLGIYRRVGETRKEYSKRLESSLGVDSKELTEFYEKNTYAKQSPAAKRRDIRIALRKSSRSYEKTRLNKLKRALSFLSPLSLERIGRW